MTSRSDGRHNETNQFYIVEESPGSMDNRCRIIFGGGNSRESATENIPPYFLR